jgi:hypothetical protein
MNAQKSAARVDAIATFEGASFVGWQTLPPNAPTLDLVPDARRGFQCGV